MVKVAVTGGTGFVGRNLVERLIAEGHDVTVLTHRESPERIFDAQPQSVRGSIGDVASLKAAFEGNQAVYHLVGIIAETKTQTFEKTVVEGTTNVIEACRQAGVNRIIYLSAMGTSKNAPSKYHQSKYLAEQAVIASGIDYVIYRPSVIYGLGDGFVSMLTNMVTSMPFTPVVGKGKYKLQPAYIDDVVYALAQGLTNERALNQIIEIGGPDQLEYVQILSIIKKVLNKSKMNFHIPVWVMKAAASVLEKILKPAPITRDQLIMMEMGNIGDISRMKEIFSLDPIEFEQGLRKYLR